MDAGTPNSSRESTAHLRKQPATPHRVIFAAESDGKFKSIYDVPPSEIFVESTDSDGEVAFWFDDYWWLECLRQWGGQDLVIHFLPSPNALLNPVVLHHLVMIKRVAPKWRTAGYGYTSEICGDADVEALAQSAYDEVRLLEGARNDKSQTKVDPPQGAIRIEDLFARVRQIQKQLGTAKPILVRAREIPTASGDGMTEPIEKAASQPDLLPQPQTKPQTQPTPTQPMAGKVTN